MPDLENGIHKITNIGRSMGKLNQEIRGDMLDACDEAIVASEDIVELLKLDESGVVDKEALSKAGRQLLSSVTKILLLSDKVAVKKMVDASNKVSIFNLIKLLRKNQQHTKLL